MTAKELSDAVVETRGDVRTILEKVSDIAGTIKVLDEGRRAQQHQIEELKERCQRAENTNVTKEYCKSQHGSGRWMITTGIALLAVIVALASNFWPREAKGEKPEVQIHGGTSRSNSQTARSEGAAFFEAE